MFANLLTDRSCRRQSVMELCRLHCRLASLYQLYTHNRAEERSHLNLALEVLKKSRENNLVMELRGHLTVWRADMLIGDNNKTLAACDVQEALSCFARVSNMPQLQSYALVKRFQLCMLQDDTDGAKTAVLSAIEAEQKQPNFPPSLTLILCRLLSAHLNLRQATPLYRHAHVDLLSAHVSQCVLLSV